MTVEILSLALNRWLKPTIGQMFPFVAWHGAEGRTGSHNPNAHSPCVLASNPCVTECLQGYNLTANVNGGVSCCSNHPCMLLLSQEFRTSLCAAGLGRWRTEFSFSQWPDSGFQEEVVFGVYEGLVKAFEMSWVCSCEAAYCFKFCATPSVLRGNKS